MSVSEAAIRVAETRMEPKRDGSSSMIPLACADGALSLSTPSVSLQTP